MGRFRRLLDRVGTTFRTGRLKRLAPLHEATDTFFYEADGRTHHAPHVRDAINFKRIMIIVVIALLPCVLFGMWNTGYQTHVAMQALGAKEAPGWRGAVMNLVGYSPGDHVANLLHGALYFLPLYLITMLVGGAWEILFAVVRRKTVNEGLFVTGLLFPLTLPPDIPLWQAALGISFGVVIAKELFGGTGRNFLNPALAGRAFLYFSYPVEMSGDRVWTTVDAFTHATPLTAMPTADIASPMTSVAISWWDAFFGVMPGSIGETSVLCCLIGAVILLATGIASWRVMLAMLIGAGGMAALLFAIGSPTNPMFALPPHWHLVLGGFAFGLVFMATDPVSSAETDAGRWIYGLLCGVLAILIRVVNPAYPEGTMLAILLGNVFAPLIDWFVIAANVRRRRRRYARES